MTQPSATLQTDNLKITALAAFNDNYIWLIEDLTNQLAWVVDPGDGNVVQEYLDENRALTLSGILVTHHHDDHIGGISTLLAHHPDLSIYGIQSDRIKAINCPVGEGDTLELSEAFKVEVISVPGHTRDHIAFYYPSQEQPALFCGDTLFSSGCGRLFEGSPSTMRQSLAKLRVLPKQTKIYCAHEYTQANLEFALAVEPDNSAIANKRSQVAALRAKGAATVPTTLDNEINTNPFLRWDQPTVIAAAVAKGANGADQDSIFATIRQWKDQF